MPKKVQKVAPSKKHKTIRLDDQLTWLERATAQIGQEILDIERRFKLIIRARQEREEKEGLKKARKKLA